MKFDTKTSKPMPASPEHCFIRPNKNVPTTVPTDSEETTGRHVYYQATIVYTPVYASARIHSDQANSGRTKLLDETDMDSLTRSLEALLVGDQAVVSTTKGESKEEETKEEETKEEPATTTKKQVHFEPEVVSSGLGRWFFKNDNKTMSRSLRVAHD